MHQEKILQEVKSSHPWLNDRVLQAVECKCKAEGTANAKVHAHACSKVIFEEYKAWSDRVAAELRNMRPGSKAWWSKEKQLQHRKQKTSSIPALKVDKEEWVRTAEGKANLLAEAFKSKYHLPGIEENRYSPIAPVEADWNIDPNIALTAEDLQTY